MKALKSIWQDIRRAHTVRAYSAELLHIAYCLLIFAEGHGLYATVGGVLGVFLIINTISGDLS